MFGLVKYLIQTSCIVGKFCHNTYDVGHSCAVFLTMISAFWWRALLRLVFYHIMLLYSIRYCSSLYAITTLEVAEDLSLL